MTIYLVRHANAGERDHWGGDDALRPLTARGHAQARRLVDLLDRAEFERVLSSPLVRCMETVVPLASTRRMAVEPATALMEGAVLADALALVRKYTPGGAVMCTHGDVIAMLLEHYAAKCVDIGPAPRWPKASVWVLETDSTGDVVAAHFIDPPTE
jgi:8-oxo-dGTP diphosphatase